MKLIVFLHFFLFIFFSTAAQQAIPDYAKVLSEYIQIPSEEYKEKEAALYLLNQCNSMGLHTEILINKDTAFNFVASLYPLSCNKPNIIFYNHIDVVAPGDTTLWTYPPYSGLIKDSVIWGRGAVDNKGMAVAQLFAISKFIEEANSKELPYNVSLLCVSGEETDAERGTIPITECCLDQLNPLVIFGEGGSGVRGLITSDPDRPVFGISTVEKTMLVLDLVMVLESSGHGSVPPKEYALKEMIFALEKLLKMKPTIRYHRLSVNGLKKLGKYEKGLRGFIQRNFTFFFFRPIIKKEIQENPMLLSLFSNTITLTNLTVSSNPANNQINPKVTATLDCRLLPGTVTKQFVKNVHRWLDDPRLEVEYIYRVPATKETDIPEYFELISNSIKEVYPEALCMEYIFPATSDNNFFREKGIPVYGIFPACMSVKEMECVHNVNEHIHMNRMDSAIKIYSSIIHKFLQLSDKPEKKKLINIWDHNKDE
ncbi:MAG TPA: M20/M25/M40 family metallo-hydrolase [Cytophagaceae bacterium]